MMATTDEAEIERVLRLEHALESRRDVALCQCLSVMASSFFATVEAVAAYKRASPPEEGSSFCCRYTEACHELLCSVGFCLSVESLLARATEYLAAAGVTDEVCT